jgi:outer membrane protein
MKSISTILSILALIGVSILGYLFSKNSGKSARAPRVVNATDAKGVLTTAGANIAFVDLDTLENNYESFKKKKAEFEQKDKNLGADLERMAAAIQQDAMNLDKKAQGGQVTEAQYKDEMIRLQQRQQQMEQKRQNEGASLLKAQDEFNNQLQKNIRGFLEDYAAEKGFDYVLAYTKTSTILYANEEFDITQDVIDALNSGKSFSKKDDDAKSKDSKKESKTETTTETKEATKK